MYLHKLQKWVHTGYEIIGISARNDILQTKITIFFKKFVDELYI